MRYDLAGYIIFLLVVLGDAFTAPPLPPRLFWAQNAHCMSNNKSPEHEIHEVDVAIVGAGIGGLCAGAILNTLYNKKVGIYESHYLPGGWYVLYY